MGLLTNNALITAFFGFLTAQFLKVIIYKDIKSFGRYGGMPSAHVATVSALAWKVARITGYNSTETAIAAIFLAIVASDAVGLRRKVDPNSGHTFTEALAGFLLGTLIAFIIPK
ncbi:acid phosphatase [Thermosipho melanesiensis]|uniref:Acid phosphatase/vanadium-dependent haloperoxidase related n=2 Tax=Thermosipho melanesiensis TaxID=46541 RepID=A6LML0_THEM4|nr:divergent PAP2 family protein [Thermosipho melanesiensis]ABR31161.1 acid phosphatase/vanadium-dependent haloperoxidase related [Thermosipho melanesiensis BI429]APT74251.1 acid phosphatase [Thermosipho melanesiensis]OOC36190.1 acid phosphatase [Thermosipho melanesiensis]OOC37008.1 acid phosphatase [Thermosipho melanesiensis]OOC37760.1 acid phosphatase [Thermosipho melanesiensis]